MSKFKVGDIVCFYNSPYMTINKIVADMAECIWFDEVQQLHREEFSILALRSRKKETKDE